jgi:hypothetical protein
MKKRLVYIAIGVIQLVLTGYTALAHPASGIVVDKYGNVYFIQTGVGLAKISVDGKLTFIHKARDGHWLCLDEQDIFSNTQPIYFERISPSGNQPAMIFAGGGSPVIVSGDGYFYYCGGENGDLHPGAKSLVQETVGHKQKLFASELQKTLDGFDDGIAGLAPSQDGSIYVSCWNTILKIAPDGKVRTLMHPVSISDCDEDPADHRENNRGKPFLRGIAVDSVGTIYAAATSCHCVIKITSDGKVKTILKSERPWTPTGVAVRDGNIYILEYTNANGPATEGWYPRVRRLGKDGRVTIMTDLKPLK